MIRKLLLSTVSACCALLMLSQASMAADLTSPDAVKNALRTLAYVQNDMASKLPNKAYDRLPHENQEFQEAAVPMMQAVANEPADFKAKVEAQLKKAQAAANKVAEVSKTNDETKIKASITAVNDDLKNLYQLFPENLRPVPGQLGSGPGGMGGPPPGLR